jgi:hypothetical protein
MGYQFKGFLTADPNTADAARHRWDFCQVRRVEEQFEGFIIRCPSENDLHPTENDKGLERLLALIDEVRSNLAELSLQFPRSPFVYVEVDCFGGTCMYGGAHFLGGKEIATFKPGVEVGKLAEVLKPLRVQLGTDGFFMPFTRGYFGREHLWTAGE